MTQRLFVVALLSVSTGASAQTYVLQSQTAGYPGITGGTPITSWTLTPGNLVTSPRDEGTFALPLGFTFPFHGGTFTSVNVHTNGFVTFGAACASNCYLRRAIPATSAAFHNVIAPWWDDLDLGATGDVVYRASAGQMEIEWQNVHKFGQTASASFKLTLFQDGYLTVHYGSRAGEGFSATTGFENSTGSVGLPFLGCGISCDGVAFPSDTMYVAGIPPGAELIVSNVTLVSTQRTGTDLTLTINPSFRNLGQMAASGFTWRAYLSTDRVLQEPVDLVVLTSTAPLSCAPGATVSDTAVATIPLPGTGNYYVVVKVDVPDNVAEGQFGEANNVDATTSYFSLGVDLVATSISGPATASAGSTITVHVDYRNQGVDPPAMGGSMGYRIYLSGDSVLDASDSQIYPTSGDAVKVIAGGQTVSEDLTFMVPTSVSGGSFRYLLKLDPQNRIPEGAEDNNVAVSSAFVNMRQADLVLKSVDMVDPATGASTRRGLFGRPAMLRIELANEGAADSLAFKIGVVISSDGNLSLLQDTLVLELQVPPITQGTTLTRDVPFTLPLNDRVNRPFATGQYFLFALLDSDSRQGEVNETNNNGPVSESGQPAAILISAPSPDLAVVRFEAPSAAGLGDVMPVVRAFKNVGTADSPAATFRYYLSANPQVTTADAPVSFLMGGTPTASGTVTLSQGQSSLATDLLVIPAGLVPGTYYLGAVIDTEQQVTELDETNNGAGTAAIVFAPAGLRICTPSLLDPVVGRPYLYQLTTCGAAPAMPATWAVETSQGALPDGLSLSASGLLSGTPTTEGVVAVTVTATSSGRTAVARFAMRVLPTTNEVAITTPSLPAVLNVPSQRYETWLAAAGGEKPYVWRQVPVVGEVDPEVSIGVKFTSDGRLAGNPRPNLTERTYPVTFEVRDALGTTSRRRFNLRVLAPGALTFTALSVPDAVVGAAYLVDLSVKTFDDSPLVMPVTYRLVAGALPSGLKTTRVGTSLLIEGTPQGAGTHAFTIEVEDGKGRTEAADYLLRVYPPKPLKLEVAGLLDTYEPGYPVDFRFIVTGVSGVTYSLYSGTLPPTSAMSSDGHVTGFIDLDATASSYNFIVEARAPSGATALGAYSALVKPVPVLGGGGCSTTGAVAGLWAALLGLPRVLRRRREERLRRSDQL